MEQMVKQINEQAAAEGKGHFRFKTVPQNAHTLSMGCCRCARRSGTRPQVFRELPA